MWPKIVHRVCAMAGYRIERVVSVIGDGMREPVILRDSRDVGGMTFVKLAKKDRACARLLLGRSSSDERQLAKTTIIESLISKRNAQVVSLQTPPPQEDLGLDDPQPPCKKFKIDPTAFPDYLEIEAPPFPDIDGIKIKTLPAFGNATLWVELTSPVLEYLANVAKYQVATSTRSKRERQSSGAGVSFESRRQSYRARRASGECKYFSAKEYTDPSAAAADWAAGKDGEDEDIPLSQASVSGSHA